MPQDRETINLDEKFAKFTELWQPKIVSQLNDFHIKVAKVEGEFVWHKHDDTDELFMVNKGVLTMNYRDRAVTIRPGDIHVVPKGVEHKPSAQELCEIVMIEPAGTVNTGDAGGERTVTDLPWI